MKSIKSFPKTPKAPPAPPKLSNTVAQGKTSTQVTPPAQTPPVSRPSTPDKTAQGDSFKKPTTANAQASSSRPSIDAHQLQGPQVQAPQLSESEVADLALGRTSGKGKTPVRPEIQQVCNEMKQDVPGAEVVRYTDQGGHPMLKQPHLPSGTDAGVCSAMTSEWIRTGIEAGGDPKKGSQAFGKIVDNDFGGLIQKQHAESLKGNAIQAKNNQNLADIAGIESQIEGLKAKQAQHKALGNALKDPSLSPEQKLHIKEQRAGLAQDVKQGMARVQQQSESVTQKQQALEGDRQDFRAGRGGGHPGVRVHEFQPLQPDTFAQKLFDGTKEDGHYRLGLKKDGEAAEGHVLGLHVKNGQGRLLDANTAEWKTNSHKDLVNLTAEHVDRLYGKYSSFDLTRY